MRFAFVAPVIALVFLGCSENDAGSSPTPTAALITATSQTPAFITPPSAYLTDRSGVAVEGRTGTYCWQLGQRGVCADYGPWETNAQPIPIDAGKPLVLIFDAGVPRETRVRWLATTGLTPRDNGDMLDWTPRDYTPPELSTDVHAPDQPGRYALAVVTFFPEGDVTYGFYVEVR